MASKHMLRTLKSARAGDAECQYRLGLIYLEGGEGLAANAKTAYLWLNRAATHGYRDAWCTIAERIEPAAANGDAQLATWYEMAARDGSLTAAAKLGALLLKQAGGQHEILSTAMTWLEHAANAGCGEACYELGRLCISRASSEDDYRKARILLERAWEQGWEPSARILADHYWQARKLNEAHLWYARCRELADPEGCYRKGVLNMLLDLPGSDLLYQAASAGHVKACEELGIAHAIGTACSQGVRRNFKKAVHWWEHAAAAGSPRSAYLLSLAFRQPTSAMCNARRSRDWLFRAAREGRAEACLQAGVLLTRELAAGTKVTPGDIGDEDADVIAVRYLWHAEQEGLARAGDFLARIARRAKSQTGIGAECWDALMAATSDDPELVIRLRLASTLGLSARELVAFDPTAANREECFVLDLQAWRASYRRRIVLIETSAARRTIDQQIRALLHTGADISVEKATARYRRLRRLVAQSATAEIEETLFPRAK